MDVWEPGTVIGPYTLLEPIGRGGMGEVWKARDARLGRTVAIKRLLSAGKSFSREARAIAALNHPHICTIHDVGDGYFVMELLEGRPIEGPLAPDLALSLALQIASALDAAHATGIVHCDLKPQNVIVTNGRAKLVDFGIARLLTVNDADATMTCAVIAGTPAYMAPEQAQGHPADERSDIFSFGALLYELLSGRRAFAGASSAETLSAVLRDRPAPLTSPGPLSRIVARCLEKVPAARFQSARELVRALEEAAGGVRDEDVPSIAVLPFANMSSDPEQEYFSDGLTEEIINALAQLPGLKVIARTSSFAFKGKHLDIRQIAAQLGVTNILEGSVRKGGNRIRVTAQLIKVDDGSHLWSERYDRELADVFAVQDDIAAAISREMKVKLTASAADARGHTPRVEAYEAFLLARHHLWAVKIGFDEARAEYERAIALDPAYALPHAGLAEIFHIRASRRGADAQEYRQRVRDACERALALDPHLAEAHAWLGILATTYDYDWPEAKRRFLAATSRNGRLRHWDGYFHQRFIGRADEAVIGHQEALRDDPLNHICRVGYVMSLFSAGRRAEAASQSQRLMEIAPGFPATYTLLAYDLVNATLDDALGFAERAYELAPWSAGMPGLLAGLLRRAGQHERAAALMDPFRDTSIYGYPIEHALLHLASGDVDGAISWVDATLAQSHPFGMMILVGGPYGDAIRASRGWPVIAKRINLSS